MDKLQKILYQTFEMGESALLVAEALSPTERTRRYNQRHPEKVKAHLRKTVKDRVERNRARREAVRKYGKRKMEHHDIHHIGRTLNRKTRLAPRDHGPDKKRNL